MENKTFTVGNELAAILLNNGLVDNTIKWHPEHLKKMAAGTYNPNDCKRDFEYKGRRVFWFDYINIIGPAIQFTSRITENDLRASLTFSLVGNKMYRESHFRDFNWTIKQMEYFICFYKKYPKNYKGKTAKLIYETYININI